MSSVTVRVPAKVNVQLSVGPLRDDGYHDLVNVFLAVSVFDEVIAKESETVSVKVEGEWTDQVPVDDGNLAIQAARALARHAGRTYGVELVIRKAIPVAGGMAGGSADAAGALVACNELWGLGLPREDLMEIAADLGSDVPFSLLGGTAVGTGRGEQLAELPTDGRFHWVFAIADGGLSTAKVYAECDRLRETRGEQVPWPQASEALLTALKKGDARALGAELVNDLQPAALSLRGSLARTLGTGQARGALGAIVSGSGPTCAFLVADEEQARQLAVALVEEGVCRTAVPAYGPVAGASIV
ncbi:4-(cytidine 5'-diphospho)-2-C-methyl-D-erythritol kinase [Nonomuraea sp. NPDC003804]|uniref:4-(cytidine 5'-diphospho)-2-C-methyl-D-erythritol kinase n=1 Tax=Nonomuraea sp. NPDC003804 TaxID=3154547 RepID=UPI0033AC94AC